MVLEEFRKIDLTWDKATRRIYDAVRVASSDKNGRKLVVQVLNGGQVENLSGTSLHLYWETANEENKGLDAFEEVDAAQGIFQIYFTSGMVSNIGILTAHLHLVDDQGTVTSEPFKISVFEGVDNEAVESSDSFSTLAKALVDVNGLTAQLAQNKREMQNGLNSKVSHGENESISKAMLDQALKEEINNGEINVNVNTSEIENRAVTSKKRTVLGERGYVTGGVPAIVDIVNKKILYSTTGTHRIYYRNEYYDIPENTVVDYSGSNPNTYILGIWFDTLTKTIVFRGHTSTQLIKENDVLLGYIHQGLLGNSNLFGSYTYVGDRTKNYDMGAIISSVPVNFDFVNKRMEISETSQTTVFFKGVHYIIPRVEGTVMDFSEFSSDVFTKAVFSVKDRTIYFTDIHYSNEDVLIAIFRHDVENGYQVIMNGRYTINGQSELDKKLSDLDILNENKLTFNLEDSISSWWIYPLVKRFKGIRDKTYLGYTDSEGYVGVASIDNDTGHTVKSRLNHIQIDDHNAVAVDIMADGKIIAAYSEGHNISNNVHIHISSEPESVEKWSEHIELDMGERTSYAQLFYKSNKWWLFFRSGNMGWSYISSPDGLNWSEPVKWFDGINQAYAKVTETSDPNLLRVVVTYHPNVFNTNFGLAFFDTTTNEFKADDGSVIGSENIQRTDFPDVVIKDSGKSQRLLDVFQGNLSKTSIAYTSFTDETDITYKVAYYENGETNVVDVVSAGKPFFTSSRYVGGISFGKDDATIYLSREENGEWFIEKWETTDYNSFTLVDEIKSTENGYVAIRPVFETDGTHLVWQQGKYNSESFTDFLTDYRYVNTE